MVDSPTGDKLCQILGGKCVLITGGGGTIGSEIARQVALCKPSRLVCLGRRADKLLSIQDELRRQNADVEVATEVCDVRERNRLAAAFAYHHPDIIFHTAARKNITPTESDPAETVLVNVKGTINVVELTVVNNADMLLFTSSVKAFRPVCIMGATKRIGELIVSDAAQSTGKAFFTMRLSNVLESSGGVHALFHQQIETGGPVTVTHPDVERTFSTATETVSLILEGLLISYPGDVLALQVGGPISVVSLAKDMIEGRGLRVGEDIEIEYVGLRPGERLIEERVTQSKHWRPTTNRQILSATFEGLHPPTSELASELQELVRLAECGNSHPVLEQLRRIVPDYSPASP